MKRWLKRIGKVVAALFVLLFIVSLFIRYQGVQYLIAYAGGGFAEPIPAIDAYPVESGGGTNPCASGPMTVLTYNIFNGSALIESLVERYADGDLQGFKPWSQRVPELREFIARYNPDLIGFQEMGWNDDVMAIVPTPEAYALVTFIRGNFEYGDSALLYKKDRYDQLESGQFFLGPNPDLPMAFGFNRLSMLRYVNWAVLREKATGFTFLFANSHFDNAGHNKQPASGLFRQRITSRAGGMPVLVTGDFNTPGDNERHWAITGSDMTPPLLRNAFTVAATPEVVEANGTRRAITPEDTDLHYTKRIDHILVGGPCPVTVDQWVIDLSTLKDGQPMSDHDPIIARIQFNR
jgi:endonuclease/exonuclease/phosphatase family metal-dependent hydrolase